MTLTAASFSGCYWSLLGVLFVLLSLSTSASFSSSSTWFVMVVYGGGSGVVAVGCGVVGVVRVV